MLDGVGVDVEENVFLGVGDGGYALLELLLEGGGVEVGEVGGVVHVAFGLHDAGEDAVQVFDFAFVMGPHGALLLPC